MIHHFEKGTDPASPTLLLLHGTGGSERDLAGVGRMISGGSNLLGVRGNVSENGMARFFRRLAEGVFDEEDLVFRTRELNEFIAEAAERYGFDRSRVAAVGYSNGANIAASLLFHLPDSLQGAVLFHPMVPRRGIPLPDLSGTPIFIGAGRNDPLCPPAESEELAELLAGAGADVRLHWENNGHQLSRSEVLQAASWFRETF
ncbi:alpha/beta hydrolase fold domain-containing protein [Cohnella sp. CFH 77786]|uniref:alpha/beta hydrolase n=1 Tax=Cohnella sp. CFH 77786 TaxID=2662265 RepID=UPI001C60E884|nr:alpha/beta hydrolase [Cohnella sp. CFH 77786]MBW5448260.1 alpha/beta hydrolase fold domain-containing protein [Cohnella sp. CFH 77786]